MKSFKVKTILFLIGVMTIALAGWAGRKTLELIFDARRSSSSDVTAINIDPEQKKWVEELLVLGQQFKSNTNALYMEASFTAVDNTDTANAMRDVPYKMYMSGDSLYTSFGNTEMINSKISYLFVDHGSKKIMIGSPKNIIHPSVFSSNKITEMLKDEGYKVSRKINGRMATISLNNKTHVSCTEYSVKYDTVSQKLISVYAVMPEFSDNMNLEKAKSTLLNIHYYDTSGTQNVLMDESKYIKRSGSGIHPVARLKEYELVQL